MSASLRSRAARLGLVGRRGRGGGPVASVSSAAMRSAAASRLRSWDLVSDAVTVSTPPASLAAKRRTAQIKRLRRGQTDE